MKTRLLVWMGLLLAAALFACHPIFFHDMTVSWNLDGGNKASSCSMYNIGTWVVEADGPEHRLREFPCGVWDTDQRFWTIEEGFYSVTVRALEKGTDKVLAEKTGEVRVYADENLDPDHLALKFEASDFCTGGGTGNAVIDLYWNINGTADGTAQGDSWDQCSEVGAKKAVVTVGCKRTVELDCDAVSNMSGSVKVSEGDHNISIKLVDANGTALTTEAAGTVKATAAKSGEFTADFYFNSFLGTVKTDTTGSYKYATSFGAGKTSCLDNTPQVMHTTVYLEKPGGGDPVIKQFCGPDNKCYKTNGSDLGACWAKEKAVKIDGLVWGLYSMDIKGGITGTSGFEVCWSKKTFEDLKGKTDILVGAGVSNPTRALHLPKTGTSTLCTK